MEDRGGGQAVVVAGSRSEVVLASLCKLLVSPEQVSEEEEEEDSKSLENNLLFLIACARSSDGRQKLAEANAIPLLLPLLLPEFATRTTSFPSSSHHHHQFHIFTLFLKLLRNLCAGNGTNQDSFVHCKGLETLATIAHSLLLLFPSSEVVSLETTISLKEDERRVLLPPHALEEEALQMLLQLVANVGGRGECSQASVWESFFPALFCGMAQVSSAKVQEPLCMVLSSCCKGSRKARTEIMNSSQGIPIIASILNAADTASSYGGSIMAARNEWLEMLITHLCLKVEEQCFFPLLFTELGIPRNTVSSAAAMQQQHPPHPEAPLRQKLETKLPSKEQALLLEILCVWIEENGGKKGKQETTAEDGGDRPPRRPPLLPMECAGFLVDVIRHAARCAASDRLCAPAFPTNLSVLDVLGLSLLMARIHCAWDERRATTTSAKEPPPNGETTTATTTMAAKLASHGLIALMLDMLRALGPPPLPQSARPGVPPAELLHSTDGHNLQQSSSSQYLLPRATVSVGNNNSAEAADLALSSNNNKDATSSIQQAQVIRRSSNLSFFPTWDPYRGYRRDIVAVIANASYRNFRIQEEVRETDNGLFLVLEQCTSTDSNNPFLREWGLWAVRNLLEGNPRNQREFADLEAKASSVANPQLRDIGISVELNPETGRPRLVNVPAAKRKQKH